MKKKLMVCGVIFWSLAFVITVWITPSNRKQIGNNHKDTYTVGIFQRGQLLGIITNAILVTNCTPHCRAIVYVDRNTTNVFHGFWVDLEIKTNYLIEKK